MKKGPMKMKKASSMKMKKESSMKMKKGASMKMANKDNSMMLKLTPGQMKMIKAMMAKNK